MSHWIVETPFGNFHAASPTDADQAERLIAMVREAAERNGANSVRHVIRAALDLPRVGAWED